MQQLITATGRTFNIVWLGLSTVDNALRFEIKDLDIISAFQTFTDTTETAILTHVFDEAQTVYSGYTKLQGLDTGVNNRIIVSMVRGE